MMLLNKSLKRIVILMIIVLPPVHLSASEIPELTNTKVVVREHPKTGKPYVSITASNIESQGLLPQSQKVSRPDYRMLDPKVKSGDIPYDGPYSSSKRIYIFAATLATLGTVGGVVGIAAIPATGTAAAGGGAGYAVAGGAVALGTAGAAVSASKSKEDDFTQSSKSKSY